LIDDHSKNENGRVRRKEKKTNLLALWKEYLISQIGIEVE
jgi:hypothetical protein